jgi:hypothetical protein
VQQSFIKILTGIRSPPPLTQSFGLAQRVMEDQPNRRRFNFLGRYSYT